MTAQQLGWFRRLIASTAVAAAAVAAASCGDVARTGQSPAFVIIDSIEAASGADDSQYYSFLLSDVQTMVRQQVDGREVRVPTSFNDPARVTFRLALKNPGTTIAPLSPTTLNEVTITRYRVVFRRSDGRSTQGVDVPYSFDGGMTATIPASGTVTAGFNLVRHQAKAEQPLRNLIGGGGADLISTIAEITFYGRDQAGNEVSVTGSFSVNFGDFGDPN